ncbi:MAG: penicillin-binding protein activator [Rhodospirillales bacterium]|nr:penicillin-binding protein activator [Rhodospirillales bacterium]MDP6804071.1 penicillin-binding protein activator [Rhodospirillales bacterium]
MTERNATPGSAPVARPPAASAGPPVFRAGPSSEPALGTPPQPRAAAAKPFAGETLSPLQATLTTRVALLLPLSGANGALGDDMLKAAQLAMFEFANERFELFVHDTRGTPEGAADAASLAIADRTALILGPLLAKSVVAAAPAARAAAIRMLAFSSDRSVTGDGVYAMGFFPEADVERVVGYARSRGLRRFAAIAPDNEFGLTVVEALRRTVSSEGGVVSRVEYYDPFAVDFNAPIKRLAQFEARKQALAAQRTQLEGRDDEVARRALARLQNLQTIGDLPFDALMVADGGERLQAVAALLPFYDIDPGKVRILGTGQWDEPGIGAEPALIGSWFAAPPPAARAEFERRFEDVFGAKPRRLATLAYDATALAVVLAGAEGGPDYSEATWNAPSGFAGRDGVFRFRSDGTAERGLAVLEVQRNGAKVIGDAPRSFEARMN